MIDHDCRLVDERFNPAQTLRKRNYLKLPDKTSRFRPAALQSESNHAAETRHLPFRQRVLRISFQSGVDNLFNFGICAEILGYASFHVVVTSLTLFASTLID